MCVCVCVIGHFDFTVFYSKVCHVFCLFLCESCTSMSTCLRQAHKTNDSGLANTMFLPLAERLMDKYVEERKLDVEEGILTHTHNHTHTRTLNIGCCDGFTVCMTCW